MLTKSWLLGANVVNRGDKVLLAFLQSVVSSIIPTKIQSGTPSRSQRSKSTWLMETNSGRKYPKTIPKQMQQSFDSTPRWTPMYPTVVICSRDSFLDNSHRSAQSGASFRSERSAFTWLMETNSRCNYPRNYPWTNATKLWFYTTLDANVSNRYHLFKG